MLWMYLPKQVRTLARFHARDPWREHHEGEFRIDASQGGLVPEVNALEGSVPLKFALVAERDGTAHRLPDSLVGLWRSGKIAVDRLPAALHRVSPTLARSDFMAHWSLTGFQRGVRMMLGPTVGVTILLTCIAVAFAEPDAALKSIGFGIAAIALFAGLPMFLIRRLERRRREQAAIALAAAATDTP